MWRNGQWTELLMIGDGLVIIRATVLVRGSVLFVLGENKLVVVRRSDGRVFWITSLSPSYLDTRTN